jgi:hypothetical protein
VFEVFFDFISKTFDLPSGIRHTQRDFMLSFGALFIVLSLLFGSIWWATKNESTGA